MDGFTPAESFGPDVAARYDEHLRGDEDACVAFLAGVSSGRPVCEFAIGTGRIALPLAGTGLDVCGVDLSQAMLDQLRRRPGGAGIRVVRGDMARDAPDGSFGLIYLVYNTIGNLLTQQGQVDAFRNAASRLDDGGVFVVECLTPWTCIRGAEFVDVERVASSEVTLDINRYDHATQLLSENHVTISSDGIRMGPIAQRLVSPAEMDLMAQLAGLRLLDRFGGWGCEPFTAQSTRHVSVYGR